MPASSWWMTFSIRITTFRQQRYSMPIAVELIDGTVKDTERVLAGLTKDLFPQALLILNDETLPVQFSLFVDDVVPTNQRNLTDVRTRMGVLLEYELGKAITHLLPEEARKK